MYKVATLFAGCGGGCLGIMGGFNYLDIPYSRRNTEIVFANEWDKYACQTYRFNFGNNSLTEGDICNIPSKDIPNFDILTAGFPCQSFSFAGKRKGIEDARGMLFMQVARVLKEKQPLAFICENVAGILSSNGGADFRIIHKTIKECGYDIFFKVLNAANYGVPQKRRRLFMIGFSSDLDSRNFTFPSPLPEPVPLKAVIEADVAQRYYFSDKSVAGALAAIKRTGIRKLNAANIELPCPTLTLNLHKSTCQSTDHIVKLGDKYRRFTVLEAQRIQSFPDSFMFPVSASQAYKQIGNAIPPLLMWHILNSVLSVLPKQKSNELHF